MRTLDFDSHSQELTEGNRKLYIRTQRQLIGYLSDRAAEIDQHSKHQFDYELIVSSLIGLPYHEWFHGQLDLMTEQQFLKLYGGTKGPKNLFAQLFPATSIDDFLFNALRNNLISEPGNHLQINTVRHNTHDQIDENNQVG